MRFTVRHRAAGPVINITSLIDVLFLLVIFLLVSSRFEREPGIQVQLPQGKTAEAAKGETIDLAIAYDGTIYLDGEIVGRNKLSSSLKALRESRNDPTLVIRGDGMTQYEHVAKVVDLARQSGQKKFNLKLKSSGSR